MKRAFKKDRKMVKGIPSAVVLSILIHAALFLLAGMLVVFTVVKKEEKKFEPPKAVKRPKMELKKPKVRIKKTSRPKPTTRIVTKMNRASLPDIQLPEMTGMGEGLGGGIEGFDIMPDLGETTLFGGEQSIGNDLVGTFYDFKRDQRGRPTIMNDHMIVAALGKFVKSGWKPSELARYYRSPKKLYSTCVMIPSILSSTAPAAFGESDTGGWCWAVHYKGQLVHKDGIKFRFWGVGDDILLVRVGGKLVLNGCIPNDHGPWRIESILGGSWQSDSADSRRYVLGHFLSVVGDWITLEPGVPLDLEILLGEVPGGGFSAMLTVEVEGEEYERNHQGAPILPMFKTAVPTHDIEDNIYQWLVVGQATVTNGPVFCDYDSHGGGSPKEEVAVNEMVEPEIPAASAMRVWTGTDGKTMEAEYVVVIGSKVVLKTDEGKQMKIPLNQISAEDRDYITLANPPEFDIDFSKQSSQRIIKTTPYLDEIPPRILDYVFGVKMKQVSVGPYGHELKVEYFAVGEQYHDDRKFILLDRRSGSFTPSKENQFSHQFRGNPVEVMSYELLSQRSGIKYKGNLVVVTDERGVIIQHRASTPWLFDNLEDLRQIPVGAFMDKTCTRVHPTGPKRFY